MCEVSSVSDVCFLDVIYHGARALHRHALKADRWRHGARAPSFLPAGGGTTGRAFATVGGRATTRGIHCSVLLRSVWWH